MATTKYYFTIKTADQAKAGTDSNIFIILHGECGQTNEVRLNGYLSGNAFERNDTDKCSIRLTDVGNIYKISLRSDMRYAGADWLLSYIEVKREGIPYSAHFDINEWIDNEKTHTYTSSDIIHNDCLYTTGIKDYKQYILTLPPNGSYSYNHTEKLTKTSCYKNSVTKQSSTQFNTELQHKENYSAALSLFDKLVSLNAVSENFLKFAFSQGFSSTTINELITTDSQEITKSVSLNLSNPTPQNKYYLMKYQLTTVDALLSTGDIAISFSVEQSIEFAGVAEISYDEYVALCNSNSAALATVTAN